MCILYRPFLALSSAQPLPISTPYRDDSFLMRWPKHANYQCFDGAGRFVLALSLNSYLCDKSVSPGDDLSDKFHVILWRGSFTVAIKFEIWSQWGHHLSLMHDCYMTKLVYRCNIKTRAFISLLSRPWDAFCHR